ncbi:hypothetical protein [Parasitella parasitica]|uniref:Uncharacterized protein n=1 Tax=Parasitella parasitica TaxID=35722 RepID=A0A0B7NI93_9FUNG|nr:hypothetical protein [Parasitella parasitica]
MATEIRYQKPDTIDCKRAAPPASTVLYEKPNAYDEEPPKVITASRHGSRSSRMTVDSFASRYFQRSNNVTTCQSSPVLSSASTTSTTTDLETYYSPNTPLGSPPLSPKKFAKKAYTSQITSSILSQSTSTTQTTFAAHQDELLKDAPAYVLPSSPANSITGIDTHTITTDTLISKNNKNASNIVAAAAALLSNESGIVSSFFLQQSKSRTMKPSGKAKNNVIVYNFKKASILKPNQHHIYLHIDHEDEQDSEEVMVYRKVQPYSSWGLQSMLYCNQNDGQGVKVAEARRGAFQKTVSIESADYPDSRVDDITQPYIPTIKAVAANTVFCQDLVKRSQSNILFEYETWFHGSRMRWKRPSLLSHDFTCEIKLTKQETKRQQEQQQLLLRRSKKKRGVTMVTAKNDSFIDSDSDNDEDDHDNHSHKTCRRWKLIAEFHSCKLNYLSKSLGKLSIDLDIMNQVEKDRCDLLEANIVMTTCTLIDLIRDIMGK